MTGNPHFHDLRDGGTVRRWLKATPMKSGHGGPATPVVSTPATGEQEGMA